MTRLAICVVAWLAVGQGARVREAPQDCVPDRPSRVWSTIVPASVKTRVEPDWTAFANVDASDTIIMDVWIDRRGEVACVKVLRSMRIFDHAAVEAVRQWTFTPATLEGAPVAVVQAIAVRKPYPGR